MYFVNQQSEDAGVTEDIDANGLELQSVYSIPPDSSPSLMKTRSPRLLHQQNLSPNESML